MISDTVLKPTITKVSNHFEILFITSPVFGKNSKIIIKSAPGTIPNALIMLIQGFLAGLDVLVQGLADGAGTGVEFLDHSFYTLTKAGLVQIYCKDILAAVEFLQA